jgi:hypothetical protein
MVSTVVRTVTSAKPVYVGHKSGSTQMRPSSRHEQLTENGFKVSHSFAYSDYAFNYYVCYFHRHVDP